MESSAAIDPRDSQSTSLEALSARTRGLILETIHHAGAGHVGGPLSATDLLVHLYFRIAEHRSRPAAIGRSATGSSCRKGHSSIAHLHVLALRGYFPVAELRTFDAIDSPPAGPPGHDPSAGARHVDRLARPGTLARGRAWRLAREAARSGLPHLGDPRRRRDPGRADLGGVLHRRPVRARQPDRDPRLQRPAAVRLARRPKACTARPCRPDDPAAPSSRPSAGTSIECDGHDIARHRRAPSPTRARRTRAGRPASIAHTIKGKGVSFMEDDYNWHAKVPTAERTGRGAGRARGGGVEMSAVTIRR